MNNLVIRNVGQIKNANLQFGDLTVLVGPQASGKSIALQTLKLIVDIGHVHDELNRYGLDWGNKVPDFLDVYFGEGMRSIWSEQSSQIEWDASTIDLKKLAKRGNRTSKESLFFIPAQRVLGLRDGWPRPFTDYTPGDPFAVREFSERLRNLVEQEFKPTDALFPQSKRLKSAFRDMLRDNIFSNFELKVDKVRSQRRLVLGPKGASDPLPYMVWSAGQREFVPLLLGLYWLMPPTKTARRKDIRWVVLEELEMGLHPRAISVVLLLVFELMHRGYKVCLSTHSPQVLDAIWALRNLKGSKQSGQSLLQIFDAPQTQAMIDLANDVLNKTVKVHFFDRTTGTTKDISELDPFSEIPEEAGWGGLTDFSSKANELVAKAVANSTKSDSKI